VELAQQHACIAQAIAHRDGDAARDAMLDHVEWARSVDLRRPVR
jgi:DNA-binding FadR family transcriptional regulator